MFGVKQGLITSCSAAALAAEAKMMVRHIGCTLSLGQLSVVSGRRLNVSTVESTVKPPIPIAKAWKKAILNKRGYSTLRMLSCSSSSSASASSSELGTLLALGLG